MLHCVRRRCFLWVCAFGIGSLLGGMAITGIPASAQSSDRPSRVVAVVKPTKDFSKPEPFERRPAGAATVFKTPNRDAFSHPSGNMPFARQLDFQVGNGIFKKIWVSAPSSTKSSDGLGPLFNSRACQRCHIKDGRGRPPAMGEKAVSLLFRLSVPRSDGQPAPEPVYGEQFQNFSVQGVPAEGNISIHYEERSVELADGEIVRLRYPSYQFTDLAYGPMHPDTAVSPRVAPPVIGMGLLEAISEQDILAHADPEDQNADGVSGRANWVWSDEFNRRMLGRFGWKATQPTIAQQSAHAFRSDIGISTPLYPYPHGECMQAQTECRNAPHGGALDGPPVEASAEMFDLVVFYTRNLGVPARRDLGRPEVLQGKRLFYQAGCTGCHVPKFVTRRDSIGEEQSFQLIWPYTDLLLHDMGEGLADSHREGEAGGREWRTPPLWGIGLTKRVSGHQFYLHDGRARGLLEAILWHGGEAEASREKVQEMNRENREALLAFIRSL